MRRRGTSSHLFNSDHFGIGGKKGLYCISIKIMRASVVIVNCGLGLHFVLSDF